MIATKVPIVPGAIEEAPLPKPNAIKHIGFRHKRLSIGGGFFMAIIQSV